MPGDYFGLLARLILEMGQTIQLIQTIWGLIWTCLLSYCKEIFVRNYRYGIFTKLFINR